jgi:hypothetical protein
MITDANLKRRSISPLAPIGTICYNIQVSAFFPHGLLFSKYAAIISVHNVAGKGLVFVMEMMSLLFEVETESLLLNLY